MLLQALGDEAEARILRADCKLQAADDLILWRTYGSGAGRHREGRAEGCWGPGHTLPSRLRARHARHAGHVLASTLAGYINPSAGICYEGTCMGQ